MKSKSSSKVIRLNSDETKKRNNRLIADSLGKTKFESVDKSKHKKKSDFILPWQIK